ncbi:MAG: HNH endonuclease signature motif containing protein [Antarcticimicrobium sp.]|nr:HNH endonuclease signature motif containing protein [Antarcticimicrobium sp.]
MTADTHEAGSVIGDRKQHHRYSKKVTSTKRWKVLRMAILERDGFRCKSCGARGRLEIDHIKPVRTHPERSYDPLNLQALCPSCHTRKTRIECGHPAPIQTPERSAWVKAVADLATNPKQSIKGETNA